MNHRDLTFLNEEEYRVIGQIYVRFCPESNFRWESPIGVRYRCPICNRRVQVFEPYGVVLL